MIPIKARDEIEMFCALNGYKIEDIELILSECYGQVAKEVELMDHDYVRLAGVGNLFIKAWTVKRFHTKAKNMLDKTHISYNRGKKQVTELEEKLDRVYQRMSKEFYTNMTAKVMSKNLPHLSDDIPVGAEGWLQGCRCLECRMGRSIQKRNIRNGSKGNTETGLGEQG